MSQTKIDESTGHIQTNWKEIMTMKRFSETREPKIFSLLENNGEPYLSVRVGSEKPIILKLSRGECAELGLKLISYVMKTNI
ncbi:MAG: hypothetical protein ACPL3B_04945 [Fervidobacterium sp.]